MGTVSMKPIIGEIPWLASTRCLKNPAHRIRLFTRPSEPSALAPSPRQTGTHPFLNHGPLELGKYSHHLKERLTRRRSGVEPLLMQVEIDP